MPLPHLPSASYYAAEKLYALMEATRMSQIYRSHAPGMLPELEALFASLANPADTFSHASPNSPTAVPFYVALADAVEHKGHEGRSMFMDKLTAALRITQPISRSLFNSQIVEHDAAYHRASLMQLLCETPGWVSRYCAFEETQAHHEKAALAQALGGDITGDHPIEQLLNRVGEMADALQACNTPESDQKAAYLRQQLSMHEHLLFNPADHADKEDLSVAALRAERHNPYRSHRQKLFEAANRHSDQLPVTIPPAITTLAGEALEASQPEGNHGSPYAWTQSAAQSLESALFQHAIQAIAPAYSRAEHGLSPATEPTESSRESNVVNFE